MDERSPESLQDKSTSTLLRMVSCAEDGFINFWTVEIKPRTFASQGNSISESLQQHMTHSIGASAKLKTMQNLETFIQPSQLPESKPVSQHRLLLSQLISLSLAQNYLFIVGSEYDVAFFRGEHSYLQQDSQERVLPDLPVEEGEKPEAEEMEIEPTK